MQSSLCAILHKNWTLLSLTQKPTRVWAYMRINRLLKNIFDIFFFTFQKFLPSFAQQVFKINFRKLKKGHRKNFVKILPLNLYDLIFQPLTQLYHKDVF